MATVSSEQYDEARELTAKILSVLQGCDVSAGLSALNYCLAALLFDTYGATEDVLAQSDEQTRFVATLLASEKVRH